MLIIREFNHSTHGALEYTSPARKSAEVANSGNEQNAAESSRETRVRQDLTDRIVTKDRSAHGKKLTAPESAANDKF
jgi:hypothetical protein